MLLHIVLCACLLSPFLGKSSTQPLAFEANGKIPTFLCQIIGKSPPLNLLLLFDRKSHNF